MNSALGQESPLCGRRYRWEWRVAAAESNVQSFILSYRCLPGATLGADRGVVHLGNAAKEEERRVRARVGTRSGPGTRDAGAVVNTRPHNFHSFSLYLKLPWRNAFRAFPLGSERSPQGMRGVSEVAPSFRLPPRVTDTRA
ncbi:hypothetical protein E2C01_091315 [Portunus trituberculatus]|uniref:Uncharacterized protein n=1 Tax=Portunus trituberculatus TaxID=210409 RepID=A0A5B7JSL8_PORTR|nr:hypothetical protein [Portunus trituberculatus]